MEKILFVAGFRKNEEGKWLKEIYFEESGETVIYQAIEREDYWTGYRRMLVYEVTDGMPDESEGIDFTSFIMNME